VSHHTNTYETTGAYLRAGVFAEAIDDGEFARGVE